MSGIIQVFEHNNSYTKNKYTNNDSYAEDDGIDVEQEESVQLARIYVCYNCTANSSEEFSVVLLL
jgi:hypothetical protein